MILDDFLANGEAIRGLIDISKQAGSEIVGCGVVVSKVYQEGEKKIKDLGYDIVALARIKSLEDVINCCNATKDTRFDLYTSKTINNSFLTTSLKEEYLLGYCFIYSKTSSFE